MVFSKILVDRFSKGYKGDEQSAGNFYLLDEDWNEMKEFKCIELPWLNNKNNESCIPLGVYKARRRKCDKCKYKDCIEILNVPDRTGILVHNGNRYTHTDGCVIIGRDFGYVDSDDVIDVTDSINSLKEILSMCPEGDFEIEFI